MVVLVGAVLRVPRLQEADVAAASERVTKVKKTVIVGVVAVLALAGTAMAGMPPGAVKGK